MLGFYFFAWVLDCLETYYQKCYLKDKYILLENYEMQQKVGPQKHGGKTANHINIKQNI